MPTLHTRLRSLERTEDSSGAPCWDLLMDDHTTLHVTGEPALGLGYSWAGHEIVAAIERGKVARIARGERLPPLCGCCSGDGRHAYRAFARGASPADDDEECTTCGETGRAWHRATPDSCGGAKAMRRAARR